MKSFNTQDLMGNNVVRIPKIQREYAQGRMEGKKAPEVRRKFVRALLEALRGRPLQLDLVYGLEAKTSGNKGSFLPIDGQQRLTTLYLLAWFCGADMSGWTLDYKCRRAAQSFAEGLKKYPRKGGIPSNELKPSTWFHEIWLSDPSVAGMIEMLDEMYRQKDTPVADLPKELGNIQFFVEDGICGHEMEEEAAERAYGHLFLKMNARGLPLTDWEVAKNEIDKYVSDKDSAWRENINGTWQENLWPLTKRANANDVKNRVVRLDAAMLKIVEMCARFCGKPENNDFDEWLEELDSEQKNEFFQWCEDAFSYAPKVGKNWSKERVKNALWKSSGEEKCAISWNDGEDEYEQWLTEKRTFFAEQLRFAFLIRGEKFRTAQVSTQVKRRTRVLLNLLDNTDLSKNNFESLFKSGLVYLGDGDLKRLEGYHEEQLADEIWKAEFPETQIIPIECHPLVWHGSTAFLGKLSPEKMSDALLKLGVAVENDGKGLFLGVLGLSGECNAKLPCGSIWIPDTPKQWAEECFSAKRLFLRGGIASWLAGNRYDVATGASDWLNYLDALWDTVAKAELKRISTKDAGWLFCVKNSNLSNPAIRLVRNDLECERLSLLANSRTTETGIPYIIWAELPYSGIMQAKDGDWYYNVKHPSWWGMNPPPKWRKGTDGKFVVISDGEGGE